MAKTNSHSHHCHNMIWTIKIQITLQSKSQYPNINMINGNTREYITAKLLYNLNYTRITSQHVKNKRCSMQLLTQKWIISRAFILRRTRYDWRIIWENTNVSVMFLFCLIVTVLTSCSGSGHVCFKGVVVADIQVTSCHLCKPWDEFHEGWEGGSFTWVTVPAFQHDGVPVLLAGSKKVTKCFSIAYTTFVAVTVM